MSYMNKHYYENSINVIKDIVRLDNYREFENDVVGENIKEKKISKI